MREPRGLRFLLAIFALIVVVLDFVWNFEDEDEDEDEDGKALQLKYGID